jgi:hypothetical protein
LFPRPEANGWIDTFFNRQSAPEASSSLRAATCWLLPLAVFEPKQMPRVPWMDDSLRKLLCV